MQEIIEKLKSVKLSILTHPDCEPDSEFEDMVDTIVEGVGKVIADVEERYTQQQMEIGQIVDDVFTKEDTCFEDDDSFQCCDNCDLPDACYDYGCAIKLGLRRDKGFQNPLLAEFFLTVFIHNIMDIKFYANVIEMRKWQKEYFQTRSRRALDQAKHFEREVDKQLAAASALMVDTIVEGVGKVIADVEERYTQQQMEIGQIVDDVFKKGQ